MIHFLTLILFIHSSTAFIFGNPNLFNYNDLHIVETVDLSPKKHVEFTTEYFESIGNPPLYNPLLLESVSYNDTGVTPLNAFQTLKGPPSQGRIRKMANISPLLTLLELKLGTSTKGQPSSYTLLRKIIHYIQPNYIFALVENPSSPEYHHGYTAYSGTSTKLFLFSKHQKLLHIPCLVCESTSIPVRSNRVTLATLTTLWNSYNGKNMNGKNIIFHGFQSLSGQCGSSLGRFNPWEGPLFCTVYTLSSKYNFTIANYGATTPWISGVYRSILSNPGGLRYFAIAKLSTEKFQFAIITSFPMTLNTFQAFIAPFDSDTWSLILTSCAFLVAFIFLENTLFRYERNRSHLADGTFNMLAPLLGQVCSGNVLHLFYCKAAAGLVWILWLLFMNSILIQNLYQGSIYSFLTITLPPQIPQTMPELSASNIPIITMSQLGSRDPADHSIKSVLKHFLIPKLKLALEQNASYGRLLSAVNSRIVLITAHPFIVADSINKLLPIDDVPTNQTLAIMDSGPSLGSALQLLEASQQRYIVRSGTDTLINNNVIWQVNNNFILPPILRHIRQLEESGLLEQWRGLETLFQGQEGTRYLGRDIGRRWFNKEMSGGKDTVASSQPVAVTLVVMTFVWVLWGGILSFAWVAVAIECLKVKVAKLGGVRNLFTKRTNVVVFPMRE